MHHAIEIREKRRGVLASCLAWTPSAPADAGQKRRTGRLEQPGRNQTDGVALSALRRQAYESRLIHLLGGLAADITSYTKREGQSVPRVLKGRASTISLWPLVGEHPGKERVRAAGASL